MAQPTIDDEAFPETSASDTQPSVLGFNGERISALLGGYHLGNGYRVYSPTLRRFTSPDSQSPFGKGGINPYAYCAGDPINNTDPTGHVGFGIIGRALLNVGMFAADLLTDGMTSAAGGGVEAAGREVGRDAVGKGTGDLDESIAVRTASRASSASLNLDDIIPVIFPDLDSSIPEPREIPDVSRPIPLTTGIETVYRWDSRPPSEILKRGFEGTGKSRWWNKIFGSRTIYSSRDIDGAISYLHELKGIDGLNNNNDVFYLYKIDVKDVPAVDINFSHRHLDVNDDAFSRAFSERHIDPTNRSFVSTKYAKQYASGLAEANKEVQIQGPIMPKRIQFLLSKDLRDLPGL